ncbi:MAG: winged helix-turn-helix transcriptional regulator [Candidatus Aenigmarchaeota archaeon]|nr:winged helix-turn-helix transcriptional regulator [Candidatus Aenigmarchaeota archaeon]
MSNHYYDELKKSMLLKLLQLLGKKWSMSILISFIDDEKQQYCTIMKKFKKAINPTLLSERLKSFEKHSIIMKCDDGCYQITELGKKVITYLDTFKEEMEKNNFTFPEKLKSKKYFGNVYY